MGEKRWLIYGVNGYTGKLIAREACRRGLNPVLAGRAETRILTLARELDCECRIFPLNDFHAIARHLVDIELVLHCAGPFSTTSALMVEACLASTTHYLDITGELQVFESIHRCHGRARDHGVVLCPGVGFDVIPTDCVAATLKEALPDADYLALGFDSRSGLSPGTAKTSLEGLAQGGRIRRDGMIINVPLAYRVRCIDFGTGEKNAMTIPWGDLATAYYTTGIANIETYVPASSRTISGVRTMNYLRPVLSWKPLQDLLKGLLGRRIAGPDENERRKTPTYVWGEVSNPSGKKKTARIQTANGYDVTVHGAIETVGTVLSQGFEGGYYTPSQLLGRDLIARLPGTGPLAISEN